MIRKYWQKSIDWVAGKLGYEIDRRSFDNRQKIDLAVYALLNSLAFIFVLSGLNIFAAIMIVLTLIAIADSAF